MQPLFGFAQYDGFDASDFTQVNQRLHPVAFHTQHVVAGEHAAELFK